MTWDSSKHPRHPAGSSQGGEFSSATAYAAANPEMMKQIYNLRRSGLAGPTIVGSPVGFTDAVHEAFKSSEAGQRHAALVERNASGIARLLNSQATYSVSETKARAGDRSAAIDRMQSQHAKLTGQALNRQAAALKVAQGSGPGFTRLPPLRYRSKS